MYKDIDDFERCHKHGFMDAHRFLNPELRVRRTRVPIHGCPWQDDREEPAKKGGG